MLSSAACSASACKPGLLCCAVAEEHPATPPYCVLKCAANHCTRCKHPLAQFASSPLRCDQLSNCQSCSKCNWILSALPSPLQAVHHLSLSTTGADFHCSLHGLQPQAVAGSNRQIDQLECMQWACAATCGVGCKHLLYMYVPNQGCTAIAGHLLPTPKARWVHTLSKPNAGSSSYLRHNVAMSALLALLTDSLLIWTLAEQGNVVSLEVKAGLYRPVSMILVHTCLRLLLHCKLGPSATCLETATCTVYVSMQGASPYRTTDLWVSRRTSFLKLCLHTRHILTAQTQPTA